MGLGFSVPQCLAGLIIATAMFHNLSMEQSKYHNSAFIMHTTSTCIHVFRFQCQCSVFGRADSYSNNVSNWLEEFFSMCQAIFEARFFSKA